MRSVKPTKKFNPLDLSHDGSVHLRLLKFIAQYTLIHNVSPSMREMQEELKISSTSVVNYYLERLAGEELIMHGSYKSRTTRLTQQGLVVIKAELCPACGRPVLSH